MKKILVLMSGSIAAYKVCSLISQLKKSGYQVKVAVTADVLNFVGLSSLEGLSGEKVYTNVHEPGEMMSHIDLNKWADVCVLCPASANTLAKLACGFSDNLVSSLFLARDLDKPYLIFPAMNPKMWAAPQTQKNIANLKNQGCHLHLGEQGSMACGDYGVGRLMEPEKIFKKIEQILKAPLKASASKKKVLITAGGTTEVIDAVRAFTNISSGQTGAFLASGLSSDYVVTFLGSKTGIQALKVQISETELNKFKLISFTSFCDLKEKLFAEVKTESYDAVIHCAAVSDFSPVEIQQNGETYKLPLQKKLSTSDEMDIKFKRNSKIIERIKKQSKNPNLKLVGFKLLEDKNDHENTQNQVNKVLNSSDYVVLNFVDEVSENQHEFYLHSHQGLFSSGRTKPDLLFQVKEVLKKAFNSKSQSIRTNL